ncbi:GTP-binding protein Di-Ras1-like [Homalodisca vitripennis]|uniref:GTP-binding protein Di-Ras1-like n=1 Tax=Homalodisca vitripennis TaxID=197043 RepID=UPI001EEA99F7|nr:GTP-binding protein Di-Ras1-like [Homalodisca vitripennis]
MPGHCERMRLPSLGTESSSSGASCGGSKEHHRVVVMGAARVGKSSIISQFLYDRFLSRYRETVEELHRGEYELQDGACLTLDILDTSGAYQFPAMRALSVNTAHAFILVYSVDDEETWQEVIKLRDQIVEQRGPMVPIVVVGNKSELADRAVSRELAETVAVYDWECGYVECSAKENQNIIQVFKELLVQAKIHYNLSPAVKRRRQSLPNYVGGNSGSGSVKNKYMLKRNSCSVA